ncbi:MAG: AIR synthase-related protein, partial [Akkermansia sp.]
RLYHDVVADMRKLNVIPKAYAHITGGGLPENLERFLGHYGADLTIPFWDNAPAQKILKFVDDQDRFNTFNMGIGWIAIVKPEDVDAALTAGEGGTVIGTLREGAGITVKVNEK